MSTGRAYPVARGCCSSRGPPGLRLPRDRSGARREQLPRPDQQSSRIPVPRPRNRPPRPRDSRQTPGADPHRPPIGKAPCVPLLRDRYISSSLLSTTGHGATMDQPARPGPTRARSRSRARSRTRSSAWLMVHCLSGRPPAAKKLNNARRSALASSGGLSSSCQTGQNTRSNSSSSSSSRRARSQFDLGAVPSASLAASNAKSRCICARRVRQERSLRAQRSPSAWSSDTAPSLST